MFEYTQNTPINIEGRVVNIRFENGITGLGSRKFWINDTEPFFLYNKAIIYSNIEENKDKEFTFIQLNGDYDYHRRLYLITKEDLEKSSINPSSYDVRKLI